MQKKIVLIVEDDLILAQALEIIFKGEEYDLRMAYDGVEAEKIIAREIPDIILLDLLMPRKDGFEVLKDLKKNVKTKDVPVIIFTDFDPQGGIEEVTKLGVKDYVIKSNINISQVPQLVKKYL